MIARPEPPRGRAVKRRSGPPLSRDLHVGVAGPDGAAHPPLRQLGGADDGGRRADRRLGGRGGAPGVVRVARSHRGHPVPQPEQAVVFGNRRDGERIGCRAERRGAGGDLVGVHPGVARLPVAVVPEAAAAERGRCRGGRREDRGVVDLRPAAVALDLPEARAGIGRPAQQSQRAVAPEGEDPPLAVVDEASAGVVVHVPAIGDHLGASHDQLARMTALVAPDLAPCAAGDVVGQRDEVEPGATRGERPEGVAERLGHGRVAVGRVLGVHVHVARIPTRPAPRGPAVVAGRAVGLVGEGGVVGEIDLHPPGDLAVGVALRRTDHRRHAQLDRPPAPPDGSRQEGARGLPGRVDARAGGVLSLAREALGRDRHVRVARAAPAAELADPPQP